MASIRLQESIASITKTSTTGLSFPASTFNVGGLQFRTTAPLTLNTSVIGPGGVESALVANKLYYVYAIVYNGTPALIASLNSTGPTGYAAYRLVGQFDTTSGAVVQAAAQTATGTVGEYRSAHLSEAQFQAVYGPGWVLCDGRNVAGSAYATLTGSSTIPDARGSVLRGKSGASGRNPDGDTALGTYQSDTFVAHNHGGGNHGHSLDRQVSSSNGASLNDSTTCVVAVARFGLMQSANANASGNIINTEGGNETRMKNVTVNHFIKIN